jgi:hypothetical protein
MDRIKLNHKYPLFEDSEEYFIVREDRYSYYVLDSESINLLDKRNEIFPVCEVEKGFCLKEAEETLMQFFEKVGIEI